MLLKQFHVSYGKNYARCDTVVLSVGKNEPLTPTLAGRAARIACGHTRGVKVWSTEFYGYHLTGKTIRKITHKE